MTEFGLDSIKIAKQNGSWNKLDNIETRLEIPEELKDALNELGLTTEIDNQINYYFDDALNSLKSVKPLSDKNTLYQVVLSLQQRES